MPSTERQLGYDIDAIFQTDGLGADDLGQAPSSQSTYYDGLGAGAIVDGNLVANFQQIDGAIFSGKTSFNNTETGYRLGLASGVAKFYIGDSTNYLNWTGTALNIAGALSASTIDIGGADATSFHVDIDGNMWLGAATFAAAPAKVSNAGAATFSSVTLSSSVAISGIANNSSTDISLLSMQHNITFSASDHNTVAWTSGTITLSNGRTFSISSGNTGNITTVTYIYLDTGTSSTVLQTTTTHSTAVGANKILICVAQNVSDTAKLATFQVLGGMALGSNPKLITGDVVVADTLTANQISSLAFTGKDASFDTGNIGGWTLSSNSIVSGDDGGGNTGIALNGNAGVITLGQGASTSGYINVGAASAPLTGNGIYIGYDQSGTYNFDLRSGNPAAVYMHWDGSAGTLNIVGGSLNVGTTGNVRGGSTDYLTGTGFFLGYSGAAHKFSVGNPSDKYIAWDGSAFVVNGFTLTNKGTFGGDGSNGALSGTTVIDLGNAAVVTKNYTSISLTGTQTLTFTNPHANGTIVILKSQGNVTITSTASPAIDLRGMGAEGGAGQADGGSGSATDGSIPTGTFDATDPGGTAGQYNTGAGGEAGTRLPLNTYTTSSTLLYRRILNIVPGAGGGGGGAGPSATSSGGSGGRGGGALLIECNGALNFTGTINSSGGNATAADTASGTDASGGGGGGGAAGMVVILYNTLTANSGTITATGGNGTAGGAGAGTNGGHGSGGGGGATAFGTAGAGGQGSAAAGGNGAASSGAGGGGGAGIDGLGSGGAAGTGGTSMGGVVAQNLYFA